MFITSMVLQFSQSHQSQLRKHQFISPALTQKINMLLPQALITIITFIIRKVCCRQLSYINGTKCVYKILHHLRFSYSNSSNRVYKCFRKFLFWTSTVAMVMVLLSNMSLLNPGPAQKMTGIYQNVRGLIPCSELGNANPILDNTKLLELNTYLCLKHPDVVVLNETWLKPSIHSNEIIPPSLYKSFRLDRSEKTHPRDVNNPNRFRANGGGVLIAVHNNLEAETKVVNLKCKAEILAVEFKLPNGQKFCIGTCYRVGTLGESNRIEILDFLSKITRIKKYTKFYMVGDLNLPSISAENWEDSVCSDSVGQDFIDMFNDLDLKQLIREPTHTRGNLLDIFLTNYVQGIQNLKVLSEHEICKSDHFPVTFDILEKAKRKKSQKRKILNYKKASWGPLNNELTSQNWTSMLADIDHVETSWKAFEAKLNELSQKYIPTITVKSDYKPPWFDAEVFELCREKEKWRSKYKKSKSDGHYMKFSLKRTELKNLVKMKMNENFGDDLHENAITKKFWSYVKSTSNSSRIPESVHYNERNRSLPSEQATLFNQFFADQFSSPSNYNIDIDLTQDFSVAFELSSIESYLKLLNVNKAPGPDKFHGMLLKNCASSLAYPLSILFNKSYSTGVIPADWKLAHVVPVHKKGSKNNVENYRPISLTSIIMKTYEKIIRDELMRLCSDKIVDFQHGFLPNRSCETQLIPFYDDLALSLNDCSRTDVVYFDFAKAFDSVNHDKILHKLKYQYNIDGQLLRFFVAYLKDRVQQVVVGGAISIPQIVLSGVPQGSILGPTLFVLFINDIGNAVNLGSTLALYADDTKLYRKINSTADCEMLQNDINTLNTWAIQNKMKFHPDKCKVLSITLKRSTNKYIYKLGNTPIQWVSTEKDLGVHFNSSLNWTEHCNYLYSKANKMLGLARRTCYFISNIRKRRTIYLTLVRSQFEHCSTIWRPCTTTSKTKIESIQRKAVRWILGHSYRSSMTSSEYFMKCKELNLLSIDLRLELNDLKMLYKIVNERLPVMLPPYITWFSGSRLRSSHMDKYCLVSGITPRVNASYSNNGQVDNSTASNYEADTQDGTATSFSKFSNNFFYRVIHSWNSLPLEIRTADSFSCFLSLLEKHLWSVFYERSYKDVEFFDDLLDQS